MGQYRETGPDLTMGNIAVGGEYFPIPWYKCIPKAQRKMAETMDEHHVHDVISGCDVVG